MGLESLKFTGKHLMVRISTDKYNVVEFPEKSHLIGIKGKPSVHTFLNDSPFRICA